MIGQDADGLFFQAPQLPRAQPQVLSNLRLDELLHVALGEDVVDAPGAGLCRDVRSRLDGLDPLRQQVTQCGQGIGLGLHAEQPQQGA